MTSWSSLARSQEGKQRVQSIDARRLYLVIDARADLDQLLRRAIAGGVDIVQIRDKALPDAVLLRRLDTARTVTAQLGVPLVINDRPDLGQIVGADYVHVGQEDLPTEAVRRFGMRVGQSTHAESEIEQTQADYIGVGPVHATPTKEGRPAVGLDLVRFAAENARVPWFAIGGIAIETIDDVLAAGATRVAVVRSIAEADDPEAAASALRKHLEQSRSARVRPTRSQS